MTNDEEMAGCNFSIIIMVVVAVSAFAAMGDFELSFPSAHVAAKKPFYVGVTYCGS